MSVRAPGEFGAAPMRGVPHDAQTTRSPNAVPHRVQNPTLRGLATFIAALLPHRPHGSADAVFPPHAPQNMNRDYHQAHDEHAGARP
jgi:hypothetical protein